MLDFMMVATRSVKKDLVEIYPKFIIRKTDDLMIRGGDFYAIWVGDAVCGQLMSRTLSSLSTGNLMDICGITPRASRAATSGSCICGTATRA